MLEDSETDKNLQVKKGKVLWHSKDRDEVYRKARELRPKHSAILYTGKVAEDAAVVLFPGGFNRFAQNCLAFTHK